MMTQEDHSFELIVIGAGAAGMMAAITAARHGKKVLLLEKLSAVGAKLKATGGGRCNLTNTLSNEAFMERFGRDGRFMREALEAFDHEALMAFFEELGVLTHAPDGYRVFPLSHQSSSIIEALEEQMQRLGVVLLCGAKVLELLSEDGCIKGVKTAEETYGAPHVIVATGGLGYPMLGAQGDGFGFARSMGHKVSELYPAMMPLHVKENWVQNCRADTIAGVEMRVNVPKHKKLKAVGDLIFTRRGIRGPVVLDFAREITAILDREGEVPLLVNLTKGLNAEHIRAHLKNEALKKPDASILEHVSTLLPLSVAKEVCVLSHINADERFGKLGGQEKDRLIALLAWTPLTVVGHDGFKSAMITRGGVCLKEICPKTMQSKLIKGLYFCGEVMNLDGPCGGFNLQWSFSSGYIAGQLC